MEIKQAIDSYLEWKAFRSPRAAEIYKSYLYRFNDFIKKDTRDLDDYDVVRFNQYLSSQHNIPTVAYSCRVLRNFVRYLTAKNETYLNTFFIQEPKYAKTVRHGISTDEFNAMCATLNPKRIDELQKLTVLHMLRDTGVRVSELCDLDINQMSSTDNYTSIETKKNKQTRWIMWGQDFHKNLLIPWLGSRICLNQSPSLFISLDKRGRGRITRRTVERWVQDIAKEAGIQKRVHPHMFRHAKAHSMKAQGAGLKDIQQMLGHVSPFSALVYLNFDKNEMLENARKYL